MTLLTEAGITAAGIIFVLCCVMVFHERYEDGLIGRLAILGMGFNCLVIVYDALSGTEYMMLPTTSLLYIFLAAFMLRHFYRFWKWTRTGVGDWKRRRVHE